MRNNPQCENYYVNDSLSKKLQRFCTYLEASVINTCITNQSVPVKLIKLNFLFYRPTASCQVELGSCHWTLWTNCGSQNRFNFLKVQIVLQEVCELQSCCFFYYNKLQPNSLLSERSFILSRFQNF